MGDQVELLPCPFCGGKAVVANIPKFVGIECGSCGADIGANPEAYPSDTRGADVWIAEIAAAWNRRAVAEVVVTDEMVERAAKATFNNGSVVSWETALELITADPRSAYSSIVGSFRIHARAALTAALKEDS